MNCRIDGCIHRGTFGVGTRSCRKGSSSFGTKMSRPKRYGQCFSIVPIALALLYRTFSALLQVMECRNSLYECALEHTSRPSPTSGKHGFAWDCLLSTSCACKTHVHRCLRAKELHQANNPNARSDLQFCSVCPQFPRIRLFKATRPLAFHDLVLGEPHACYDMLFAPGKEIPTLTFGENRHERCNWTYA